ncbi:protein Wnt-6-like isoform X2 [Portunus trituberculatus]|uniref:protein Wnt-6-like isoform X2 n=1 Tax=Portunus trituberculatus TaxID=210409 RepID=UPI001E1D0FAE|nr:protein Wnt-6-like isoform X2 [Portunus trituberculatus]
MARSSLLLCLLLLCLSLCHLAHALWWSLGHRPVMDHSRICRKRSRRLAKDPQSVICRQEPPVFPFILEGSHKALRECQSQFSTHRWNCSDNRRSMKRVLSRDTPETAFLNAVVSAGVTHEITAACSRGDLLQCSCSRNSLGATQLGPSRREKPRKERLNRIENRNRNRERYEGRKKKRGRRRKNTRYSEERWNERENWREETHQTHQTHPRTHQNTPHTHQTYRHTFPAVFEGVGGEGVSGVPEGEWHWSGCDDNVGFGYRIARDFMDWRYLQGRESQDIRSIVLLWNNEAGRRAVRNNLVAHCKCHGLSGSCTHRTCWRRIPNFRNVGRHLKDKFNAATKVMGSNDGRTVFPTASNVRTPKKQDLVYLEDSPNFCSPNKRTGSLGTKGRVCNTSTYDLSGCELLCCGRGFTQEERWVEENCRCRFSYCCEVTCETCRVKRVTARCR